MKAVIQRVNGVSLVIDGAEHSRIGRGLLILLGVREGDTPENGTLLAKKCGEIRIFEDEQGKMNRSVKDVGGEIMVVSNFTLYADCSHGRRPSFIAAARPEQAIPLYEKFLEEVAGFAGVPVQSGVFGADMKITLLNDGPVTLVLDTAEL